jgi:hypothetical protein
MHLSIFLTTVLLATVFTGGAHADFYAANDILVACEDQTATSQPNVIRCMSYIMGINDLMTALHRANKLGLLPAR